MTCAATGLVWLHIGTEGSVSGPPNFVFPENGINLGGSSGRAVCATTRPLIAKHVSVC